MKKYLVETIFIYRNRYIIEAEELGHAYDEVVSNPEITELSQKFIDENIISGREVSDQDIQNMLIDLGNQTDSGENSSYWMGTDYFINQIEYDENR